jgi:hypothetical protein
MALSQNGWCEGWREITPQFPDLFAFFIILYFVSFPALIFDLTNGIRKMMQAIKKMTLAIKVKLSSFFRLDAMKKMAHIKKTSNPLPDT